MKRIIITGEKGGTGKSTIAAFLCEYLNSREKKVQVIDLDPLQIIQNYARNCQMEGRTVTTNIKPDYQLIDTAGLTGASAKQIKEANLIIVPFRPHYIDLLVIIPWFTNLKKDSQEKVLFLPNFWRNTKEQREGLKEIKELIEKKQAGKLTTPLTDKPARYGAIINGFKQNFFDMYKDPELEKIMEKIISETN